MQTVEDSLNALAREWLVNLVYLEDDLDLSHQICFGLDFCAQPGPQIGQILGGKSSVCGYVFGELSFDVLQRFCFFF